MTTQLEHTINDLHRAANTICDAWGRLQFEQPPDNLAATKWGDRIRNSGPADPTANTALHHQHATAWLAELHDVTHNITKAANIQITTWEIEPTRRALHAAIEDLHLKHGWKIDDLIDLDPQSPNYRRDVFGLERLADTYGEWFPTHNDTPDNNHDNPDDDNCGDCGLPTQPGRDTQGRLQRRRIDGTPYHTIATYAHGACWWNIWRQRRTTAA